MNLLYLKWKTRNRSALFHITGDVHYAILALPADKTLLTIHDLVFLHSYKGFTRTFLKWIFLDLPLRKAKFITTISEKSKQEIIQYAHYPPKKIRVIPNPVECRATATQQKEQNSAQPDQPIRLLFLGTKPNKNLELTVAALYKLPIHLTIIGPLTARQQSLLKKFKIDHSSKHEISDAELSKEYDRADIILFPSLYEGFGLPIIEGFQAGKPIITSNISPMSDIAADAAIQVNPHSIPSIREGVEQAIQDIQALHHLTNKGIQIAKQYAPRNIAADYHQLWTHVWHSRNTAL